MSKTLEYIVDDEAWIGIPAKKILIKWKKGDIKTLDDEDAKVLLKDQPRRFKEVKENLANGQNIYIRGLGSFITKKRAAKIGRNIKKNIAVAIPEHLIPAFKPAKEFVNEVKSKRK